jgi:serine protease Do
LTVTAVQPGGPAEKAGLRVGDEILRVDGKAPAGLVEFNDLVGEARDHKVSLALRGKRDPLTVQLTPFSDLIKQRTGLTLTDLTREEAGRLGVQAGKSLFVKEVEKNSPASRAQLQAGYLIADIGGQSADNLRSFGNVIAGAAQGDKLRLSVVAPRQFGGGYVEYRRGVVELVLR